MVFYMGQNRRGHFYKPSEIGQEDGQSEVTIEKKDLECFFCKEAGEEPDGEITVFLGRPLCPYHRKCAEEGFNEGMAEQSQEIQDKFHEMSN